MLTKFTFNLANAPIRHETLQGKKYLVAPMVMITEGVHNGSGGPLLYKAAEIKRAVPAWNMKPIVVYHPEIDGKGCTACDPLVLEKQQVGMVMGSRWVGNKLRAEAWIEEALAEKVDARVIKALESNSVMEVSTGLFTENVGEPGKWKEEEYVAEATNHQPDHLALLPDQIGACSVADGAGLLQINEAATAANVDVTRLLAREMDVMRRLVGNAMSYSNVRQALSMALQGRVKSTDSMYPYIVDVYPDFFVYEAMGPNGTGMKLYKMEYTAKKDEVTIDEGTPVEVVRVTEYRTAEDGKFVGNEARTTKEKNMDRKKVIDGLIGNEATGWEETDRAALEKMDDANLELHAKAATPKKKKPGNAKEDAADGGADDDEEMPMNNKQGKGNKAKPPAAPQTAEEYIANAPAAIRDVLTNGMAVHEAEKGKCIAVIMANKKNAFTKEFLATKGLAELQGLAAMAAPEATTQQAAPAMFFGGQATPAGVPVANAATEEEPLLMPQMNFEKK